MPVTPTAGLYSHSLEIEVHMDAPLEKLFKSIFFHFSLLNSTYFYYTSLYEPKIIDVRVHSPKTESK